MTTLAIFILSLPFLILAIIWIPIGIFADIIFFPVWGTMGLIFMLRGESGMWRIFLMTPFMMLDMYLGITGFLPEFQHWLEHTMMGF